MGKKKKMSSKCMYPQASGLLPLLVITQGKSKENQIFWSIDNPEMTHLKSFPELRNKKVLHSSCGWLVLFDEKETQCCLWNPETSEEIKLPKLPQILMESLECTLTSPPSEATSLVILFYRQYMWWPRAMSCRPGGEYWKEHNLFEEIKNITSDSTKPKVFSTLCRPVTCKGRVYALTDPEERLVTMDREGERLAIRSSSYVDPPRLIHCSCSFTHMVESCGELFFIRLPKIEGHVVGIEIFRLDFPNMVWTPVVSAKDRVFFIAADSNEAFCCLATEAGIEGNCVYFTINGDKSLYRFNIEDGTVLVTMPFSDLPKPWHSAIWIMPQLKRVASNVNNGDRIGEEIEGMFSWLGVDMLLSIREWLDGVDCMRFRSVNKLCQLISPPGPDLLRKFSTSSLLPGPDLLRNFWTSSSLPWLMNKHLHEGVCSVINPLSGTDQRFLFNLPTKPNELKFSRTVCYSKHGWSLIFGFDYERLRKFMFFWNPSAREVIKIPEFCLSSDRWLNFCFSSLPTSSSDCIVAGMCDKTSRTVDISLCFPRDGRKWYEYSCDSPTFFPSPNNNSVFYKGQFYFLAEDGRLGVFFFDDGWAWKVLEKPERPCTSFHQNYLLECEREILSVFLGFMGKWVRVFKLNFETKSWVEVTKLGQRQNTLFVGPSASFSQAAALPGLGNTIFFPRFYGKSILFYSMASGKYHTLDSKDCLEDFYNTRELLNS